MNTLYYGDNLDVLRRYIKDESGERAGAQILAFDDTWHWDAAASAAYEVRGEL